MKSLWSKDIYAQVLFDEIIANTQAQYIIQRQLGLVPSIVRKEDKGEYIQSLVDSRENEDSTLAQDMMHQCK